MGVEAIESGGAGLAAQAVENLLWEADASAAAAGRRLWAWFGLATQSPVWSTGEQEMARAAIRSALEHPAGRTGAADRLGVSLRRLTAVRWSTLLAAELVTADEEIWRRALGERYEVVRRCCAPRTTWRTATLAQALGLPDGVVVGALRIRLARWMNGTWELRDLPGELEGAFVHGRVPARIA